MEVKTQEIIRYIDLRFKEQDLIDLNNEIDEVSNYFQTNHYQKEKLINDKLIKLREFRTIVQNALSDIKH